MAEVKHFKTYKFRTCCVNCLENIEVQIPYGELSCQYTFKCPLCGVTREQVEKYLAEKYSNKTTPQEQF